MAITLDFDGDIQKLTAKSKTVRTSLEGIADGYELIEDASKTAINGASSGQDKLAASTRKAGSALNEQRGIIEKLEDNLKRLEKGQKKAQDIPTVKKYNAEIVKTKAALDQVRTAGVGGLQGVNKVTKTSTALFTKLKGTLASTFAPLFAVGAAVQGIRLAIGAVTEFEQSAADLSAITGASGDTLEYLKQQAVEVGVETTVSASKTIEAYKLIASAKPELLDNAEALNAVTRGAITLTESFGGDLPTVATNLTDIMNKMGAGAGETTRFVNALAAGSQQGSANVDQLAASFLAAGTDINASNISLEEGVGLVEALAEKGKKGAEAGTGLRNVISKLSATDVLPKDAVDRLEAAGVNLETLSDKNLTFADRLKALAPIQKDANALVSVFGLENKTTAQILIDNVDRVEELTAAVTDTNTAQAQAAVRTATVSGEFTKLKNTLEALVQGAGTGGFSNFLALLIRFGRNGLLFIRDRIRDLQPAFADLKNAVQPIFDLISKLIPAQRSAGEGAGNWAKAVKVMNVPLKIFIQFLNFMVTNAINGVKAFARLTNGGGRLSRLFATLKNSGGGFLNFLVQLPAFTSAGFTAITQFITETRNGIAELASDLVNTFKEAFNIRKIITEGTSDLQAAVADLFSNPFAGAGERIVNSFNEELARQKAVEVEVKLKGDGALDLPESGTPDAPVDTPAGAFSKAGEDAAKLAEKAAKDAAKLAKEKAKAELDALAEGLEKQLALEDARYKDLKERLEKFNLDTVQATQQHEVNKFTIKKKAIQDAADLDGLAGEERIAFIFEQATREIDALETSLKNSSAAGLTEDQTKQIAILRKEAAKQQLDTLTAFQNDETKKAQDHEIALIELKRESFDTEKEFTEFKEAELLRIKIKYAEKQLAIIETLKGADSTAALNLKALINDAKSALDDLSNGTTGEGFSFYKLLGLDPDDPEGGKIIEGIETAVATAVDILKQAAQAKIDAAEQDIEASDARLDVINEEIDEKTALLDKERERADGDFANKEAGVLKEIALLKNQQALEKAERDKAVAAKIKAQKQQAAIDTVTQASSLITAAAQVFQSVAGIPFIGVALGATLVAGMIGSFIAAKSKVFQNISSQKAEKGMTGEVTGNRHTDGGERFGDHIEVEAGERFGILSRAATKQHGGKYAALTDALNKGDASNIYDAVSKFTGAKTDSGALLSLESKQTKVVELKAQKENRENAELRKSNELLSALLKQSKAPSKKVEYQSDRKIVTRKSVRYIIKKAQ